MAESRKQGYVSLDACILVPSIGDPIVIGDLATEINIYQNLDNAYMTCDILINDSSGLLAQMDRGAIRQGGFTGQEILVIQYNTGYDDESFKKRSHAFLLHKVLAREAVKEKAEVIVLHGISIEKHITVDRKISRAYGGEKGNRVDKIVESIVNEFVYNKTAKEVYNNLASMTNVSIKKFNFYDETRSKIRMIMPRVEPIQAIRLLASEADNDTGVPHFIFYENHMGYQFADVSKLVGDEPQYLYEYAPANYHELEYNIIEYNVVKQNDLFDSLEGGLYSSRAINLDILKKQKREVVFDYSKSGPKFPKLNNSFLVPGKADKDAVIHMFTSRTGHDTEGSGFSVKNLHGYEQSGENFLPFLKNSHVQTRSAFKKHISNFILEITVPGNSGINVGRTVILKIPQATTAYMDDKETRTDTKQDKYLSGHYLILQVRDQIKNKNEMWTTMRVIKDSESLLSGGGGSASESDWQGKPR